MTATAIPARADIAVIGVGAAGLFAAIWAARTQPGLRVVGVDGARKLGAKILVAGGGRCNVTHDVVDETAYAGSSRNAIRKVLGRFDVTRTVQFFNELGVELKREETGKLFPTTDDAHTVLEALLGAAATSGVQLVHPWRVEGVVRDDDGFVIRRAADGLDTGKQPLPAEVLRARRVILATGGRSLPKTGSDGAGYEFARALGHSITPLVTPALVPLTLPKDHFLCELSGLTLPTTLELRSPSGKRLVSFTDSTLLAHFGLSGPSVLDISRHYLALAHSLTSAERTAAPLLFINFAPGSTSEALDGALAEAARHGGRVGVGRWLSDRVPERLARALCAHGGIDPGTPLHSLEREARRRLARLVCELPLPITGDRGYTYAEVTAGGVPLSELRLETMESRVCPGLHLCGEICDVDGRIGGFNFQWAWASGFVAGCAAATGNAAHPAGR